jgi:hypothetical protein
MKIYPPHHLTLRESRKYTADRTHSSAPRIPDETLRQYASRYIEIYRTTLERFFPDIAPHISTYKGYPLKSNIVRLDHGVFIFHQEAEKNEVEFFEFDKLRPRIDANLFDIQKRFDPCWGEFDFSGRSFSVEEAELRAHAQALNDALQVFWLLLDPSQFERICLQLVEAEIGESATPREDVGLDAETFVVIDELAGFRREEKWGFEFKHFKENRVSTDVIAQTETLLESSELDLDVICLVTSGDVTSVGKSVAIKSPRIRVWDRPVLNDLFHKHSGSLGELFKGYRIAAEFVSSQVAKLKYSRYDELKKKLAECPPGSTGFKQYERVCSEILQYIFEGKLKHLDDQSSTNDGTQIRDTTFRNLRNGDLFLRIFTRFDADIIVFDTKNHIEQITKTEFDLISKYPNPALGKFAVLISPKGADEASHATQSRLFTVEKKVVLSISNEDLLEMVERKERGENPEDVLEDLLDRLLLGA